MTRPKHPPCPTCLACGLVTRRHVVCYSSTHPGPPPPHGLACECPFCAGPRMARVIRAARVFLRRPSPLAEAVLRRAVAIHDAAPAANRAHWNRQIELVQAATS